jgi:hypothetical protein
MGVYLSLKYDVWKHTKDPTMIDKIKYARDKAIILIGKGRLRVPIIYESFSIPTPTLSNNTKEPSLKGMFIPNLVLGLPWG